MILPAAMLVAICLTDEPQVNTTDNLFSLHGQIVDGTSGRPVNGASLDLATTLWDPIGEQVSSDSQGRFIFHGLPAGHYVLSASRPDFGTLRYGERQDQGTVLLVPVGPDVTDDAILFRINAPGTIAGTVHDRYGDPIERVRVVASHLVWRDGKIVLTSPREAMTDDRGRYRLTSLIPGSYTVCADAPYSPSVPAFLEEADARGRLESRLYARTCYPSANPSAQSTLRVAVGQRTELDLNLETVSAVAVRGRVVNGLPKGTATVQIFRDDAFESGDPIASFSTNQESPDFEFHGIEPGGYRLEARTENSDAGNVKQSLTARLSFAAGAGDVDGLELALKPPGAIEIVLHTPIGGKLGTGASTVGLRSIGSNPTVRYWAVQDKGALRLNDLLPGSYWLLTRTEEGVCIASAKLEGREVLHSKVTVADGMAGRLDLSLSGDCATASGSVLHGDKPVPYADILLLLSGTAASPGDMVLDSANEKGEFSLYGLGPGTYRLWAWLNDEEGRFPGPASLASEEARATTIVLAAGQAAKNVDVMLLGSEGKQR